MTLFNRQLLKVSVYTLNVKQKHTFCFKHPKGDEQIQKNCIKCNHAEHDALKPKHIHGGEDEEEEEERGRYNRAIL